MAKPNNSNTPVPVKSATPPSSMMSKLKNMLMGGTAGIISILVMYPVETVKTRVQMKSEARTANISAIGTFREIVKNEGAKSLYMGLGAALARQMLFASFRIGLFYNFCDYIKQKKKKTTLSMAETACSSLLAGGTAILTVMPFDVVFVRMQAENSLPPEQRRGYTGLFNGLSRIAKEEKVATLWKGSIPAVARAMALNFGMLVPYEKCKALFAPKLGYTYYNYILSSAIAGLGASICCLPFDNAKVKLQKQTPGADGKLPYKNLIDCMGKTLKKEGFFGYWAGFWTFYSFLFPQTVILLLVNDFLRIKFGVSKM